jgi:hypothetical protein
MVVRLLLWQESSHRSETVCRRKSLLYNDFCEIIAIQGRIWRALDRPSSTLERTPIPPSDFSPVILVG